MKNHPAFTGFRPSYTFTGVHIENACTILMSTISSLFS